MDAEHLRGELRIDLGEFRRHHLAHQLQRLGGRRRRLRHVGRPVELEAGVLDHLVDAYGRDARFRAGSAARPVEREQAAVGDQRDRPAGAIDIVVAAARRADEGSTFGTSVRRECSVRNRITFGTT